MLLPIFAKDLLQKELQELKNLCMYLIFHLRNLVCFPLFIANVVQSVSEFRFIFLHKRNLENVSLILSIFSLSNTEAHHKRVEEVMNNAAKNDCL